MKAAAAAARCERKRGWGLVGRRDGIAWDGAAAERPTMAKAEAIKMFRMKWPFGLQRGQP
jgi:hypothetical protein